MSARVLLVCAMVAITCVYTQVPYNRIAPRQNLCRVQSEDFTSWQDFSYVTPGAPSYDDGAIKQTLRTISNSTTVYQAQVYKSSTSEHSAWPLLDFSQTALGKFSTPAYIDFYFLKQGFTVPSNGFASIATFSPDGDTPSRYVSVDINAQGMVYLNNVPSQNSPVGSNWIYQKTNGALTDNTWINMTVYVDFNPSGGIMAVWQDGVIQSVANVTGSSSATLGQLHLGIVASGSISSGSIYNYGLNIMQVCTPQPSSISTAPAAPTKAPSGPTTSGATTTTPSPTSTNGPTSVTPTTTQAAANIPIPVETTTNAPDRQTSSSSRLYAPHWLLMIVAVNVMIQIL